MSDWPLDGIIGFFIIIAGLICLIGHAAFNIGQNPNAEIKNGFYLMSPMRGGKVLAIGTVLVVGILVYAALQSGHCFKMTTEENRQNQILAYIIATAAVFGGIWMIYQLLVTKYAFNNETFIYEAPPFFKKKIRWNDVTEITPDLYAPKLKSKDGTTISLPLRLQRRGAPQLKALIGGKVNSFDAPPLLPISTPEMRADLIGKTVRASFIVVHNTLEEEEIHSVDGTIIRIDDSNLMIRSQSGKELRFPPNLRSFWPNEIDEDPSTEPEFLSCWFITSEDTDTEALKRDYS